MPTVLKEMTMAAKYDIACNTLRLTDGDTCYYLCGLRSTVNSIYGYWSATPGDLTIFDVGLLYPYLVEPRMMTIGDTSQLETALPDGLATLKYMSIEAGRLKRPAPYAQ